MTGPRQDLKDAVARPVSILGSFKAVASAFIGIRGRGAHESDIEKLNPVHLVLTGIICLAIFVITLLFIVRWAVGGAA